MALVTGTAETKEITFQVISAVAAIAYQTGVVQGMMSRFQNQLSKLLPGSTDHKQDISEDVEDVVEVEEVDEYKIQREQKIEELKQNIEQYKKELEDLKQQASKIKDTLPISNGDDINVTTRMWSWLYERVVSWAVKIGLAMSASVIQWIYTFLYILIATVGFKLAVKTIIYLKSEWKKSAKDKTMQKKMESYNQNPTLPKFNSILDSLKNLTSNQKKHKVIEEVRKEINDMN